MISRQKLSRKIGHRKQLVKNLSASLILYEKIKTTQGRSKIVKANVEKLINLGKKNNLQSFRRLLALTNDNNVTKKIKEVFVPRYKNLKSGFVQIYIFESRPGDNAEQVLLAMSPDKVTQEKKTAEKKK